MRFAFGEGKGPLIVLATEAEPDDLGRLGRLGDVCAVDGALEAKTAWEAEEGNGRPLDPDTLCRRELRDDSV